MLRHIAGVFNGPLRVLTGGVSGGWDKPAFSDAPDLDPNSIIASSTRTASGVITLTPQNTDVVTYTPGTGARWTQTLKGVLTREALTNLLAQHIIRTFVKTDALHVDMVVWAGFYNSANNHGAAFGLAWNAADSAYRAVRSVNTGSGWSAPTIAAGFSVLSVACLGCADPGASGGTTLSNTAVPLDASGTAIGVTNVAVTRSAANLTGPFDTIFIEVGFRTGTGGTTTERQIASSFFMAELEGADPLV